MVLPRRTSVMAHQSRAARADEGDDVPRYFLRAFLDHDEQEGLRKAAVPEE
jgi:hypothetical protein